MKSPVAILCVISSCISLQLGAALATQLFPHAGPWATASLRLLIAASFLLVLTRPKVWTWSREQWVSVLWLGISLGLMNGFFYAAIARIPLGVAVTIEFLGPLLLAAVLSRSARDFTCVALAVTGMALLGFDSLTNNPLDEIGVILVLIAGASWAFYILSSKKTGRLIPGQGGLAVALAIGGLGLLPAGGSGTLVIINDPYLLLMAIGTGILASLIPYSLELVALRRLAANTFSILIALEPVFAAMFGWLLLSQGITTFKLLAIVLVVIASIGQAVVLPSVPLRMHRVRRLRIPLRAHTRAQGSKKDPMRVDPAKPAPAHIES